MRLSTAALFLVVTYVGILLGPIIVVCDTVNIDEVHYTYLAGIEGSSHHQMNPYTQAIARACNYTVFHGEEPMRHGMYDKARDHVGELAAYFDSVQRRSERGRAFVFDDLSFPYGNLRDFNNAREVKHFFLYDIKTMYSYLREVGVNAKFLYLQRDFYDALKSHAPLDGGFQQHAGKMAIFRQAILDQYRGMENSMQAGLWRTVNFRWFENDSSLGRLIEAWIEFFELKECNLVAAIENVVAARLVHIPHTIIPADYDFLVQHGYYNLTTPEPPPLIAVIN